MFALTATLLLGTATASAADLAAVLDGPQRGAANRTRDAARHPLQTLTFFGLAPGQTVIEVAPGAGWYTEILAPYLRDQGHLYAAHYPADDPREEARTARARFAAKLAAAPATYDRVVLGTLPVKAFTDISPPGGADLVLTFRNVHNWIEAGHLDDTLKAFHAVLKPGGVLGVEEHRAPPGTPLARVIASGYVPEELVIAHARAAGFEFVGRSDVNANPLDTHDHPNGVWSLPPTLRGGDTGRERFLAIGESDRMTLKFRKPANAAR
ncbi:methyltransferase [Rhizobacter sp. Root1221]|nr:methyltransferase [Rhizobacter sp. Root1221]